ncbi:hypothetical protein [Lacticaseibacillus porcinae]|uniref:hypothetical protein n=1 Tax=Lacticaseibacillus porcinae TaxID=1123687 RepID=UPI000F79F196|nr:hypothetical protein [Lacticaseibacillus porcinae]
MKNVKEALTKPAFRGLPKDGLTALSGRTLFTIQLVNGDHTFPSRGTFAHLINTFSTGVTVTVTKNQVTLDGHENKQITIIPTSVDIFLARTNANQFNLRQAAPVYITFLHMVGDDFDFYIRVSGGRAGKYLIDHPQQLPVHDILGLKHIETGQTEMDLVDAINSYGYTKLIEGSEVAFLDDDNIIKFASVTPH